MLYQNKVCGFLPQVPPTLPIFLFKKNKLTSKRTLTSQSPFFFCSPKLPLYYHPKSHHYDPKQQEFKIQTNNVPWLILILTILFILFILNHMRSLPPFEKTRGIKPYVPGEVRILVGCKQWKEEHNLSSRDLCMYWTRTIFDKCCSLVVCIKRWMNLDPV